MAPTDNRIDLRVFTEPQQGSNYRMLLDIAKATEELGFGAFFRSTTTSRWAM